MKDPLLLIGDIGGTNARFALADANEHGFSDERIFNCADFATADAAIRRYLDDIGASAPDAICFAAAGPIVDERVRFTNNPWTIAAADLRESLGIGRVRLLNDFEAVAYSVPFLEDGDTMPIGLPDPQPLADRDFMVGVVGPGTGLGAVGLRRYREHLIPVVGEASHGGFAPESRVQIDVLSHLKECFDRVSSERLVSGQGLENIYWALCRLHGEKRVQPSAAEIFAACISEAEPRASEAVELFFEILGQFTGDLALAYGAYDGMYIAGGIAQRYPEKLANSRFRSGFEHKGRHTSLMERIPTQLILHPHPGLLGAAYCARELLESTLD